MTGIQSAIPHLAKGKNKHNCNIEHTFFDSKWSDEYNILVLQRYAHYLFTGIQSVGALKIKNALNMSWSIVIWHMHCILN